MANFLKCVQAGRILTDLKARKKADAIREIGSLLEGGPEIPDLRQFLSKLFQKEKTFSSGVEDGVALPHYRDRSVKLPIVGLGISREGIDWGGGNLAKIIILVGWPDRHDQAYLGMVAEIAGLLRRESVRDALLKADTPEVAFEALRGKGAPPGD